VTGATQGSFAKTDKKEITGAEREGNGPWWCEDRSQVKKVNFFDGRGVFSLDLPFNG